LAVLFGDGGVVADVDSQACRATLKLAKFEERLSQERGLLAIFTCFAAIYRLAQRPAAGRRFRLNVVRVGFIVELM
jgi:hypothetical protein